MKRTKEIIFTRKKKIPITVFNLVTKLIADGIYFSAAEIHQAEQSRINVDIAPYFKSLVRDYFNGTYDITKNVLGAKIKTMLQNTASYTKV